MDKEKIRDKLTLFKIYYDRGGSLTNLGRNIVMFAMAFKIYDIGAITSVLLAIIISFGFIFMGYLDHKYGIFTREAEKMTSEINPHLRQVSDDVALIKEMILKRG